MSARDTLTPELRAEVLRLEDDLRARVASIQEVQDAWRAEYDAARAAERTAAAWEAWVDERVTLAAVAWVLTTVFVRFCEDNGLVKPVWISGPRHREAIDAQQQFLRETARTNADVTDREWLLQAVDYLKSLPATTGLVDDTSPMWLVSPSGDAATRLLNYWRERDESGALIRDLSDPDLDTRFLGDLYQDISEDAKKRYALLQTPVFVEEFILDRTLEPALNERPLEGFKMIDPTCGSGHFLLGGFQRLLDRWHKQAPAMDERERVQAALDSVYGVDINPFAVSIARFRLTCAALKACGLASLEDSPAFTYHLAAGDSLLHGLDQQEFDLGAGLSVDRVAANFAYETENLQVLKSILKNGQYDAVVGNPPYITVKDKALNELYRRSYTYCKGTYALTVPFMERFFSLARTSGVTAGRVGQITSNSFMSRDFGVPLVQKFFPSVRLDLIVDSSGAHIPGHGTPTVILVGRPTRSQAPTRAVLSVRGEPGQPADPSKGLVWSAIVEHFDDAGWSDEWISVVDLGADRLSKHPWNLAVGGVAGLLSHIEAATSRRVADLVERPIGRAVRIGADDAFVYPTRLRNATALPESRPYLQGDDIRDWNARPTTMVIHPYSIDNGERIENPAVIEKLWPLRTVLAGRSTFQGLMADAGRAWWEYMQHTASAYGRPLGINFSHIATHNHFAVTGGGMVYNRHAPLMKLRPQASQEDHVALAGVLNSSVMAFWLRQNSHSKGAGTAGGGDEPWEWRFEFNGGVVERAPLPGRLPFEQAMRVHDAVRSVEQHSITDLSNWPVIDRASLEECRRRLVSKRGLAIAAQEELDWETYRLFGIADESLTYGGLDLPELQLGERAFEIVLARQVAGGADQTAWFARHGSNPVTEIPSAWPEAYRDVVRRRIEEIESHQMLQVLEKPEHKRRWQVEAWERTQERALGAWLLDRLEASAIWFDNHGRPVPKSVAVLADDVARDGELVSVLALWDGRPDVAIPAALTRLLASEAVPFLAAHRYKDSGLRKRAAWEGTWDLQRREDAGTYKPAPVENGGSGPIPAPPQYAGADFLRPEFWANRGKFDISKERFISYPGVGREGDVTLVIGWAGWDHAQQALALATLIQSGEQQGWSEERLTPLVAGLSELLPWVEQWHSDPDPLYGGSSPAEFFLGLLDNYMAKLGATRESLAAWRPPAPTRGKKGKS